MSLPNFLFNLNLKKESDYIQKIKKTEFEFIIREAKKTNRTFEQTLILSEDEGKIIQFYNDIQTEQKENNMIESAIKEYRRLTKQ